MTADPFASLPQSLTGKRRTRRKASIPGAYMGVCPRMCLPGTPDCACQAQAEKPKRAKPVRHEDKLHTSIWKALTLLLDPVQVVFWSSENRQVGEREGARRKARGVVAGQPDMVFHFAGRVAYVELKTDDGRASASQLLLHERLKAAGIAVRICRSLDDVLAFLRECGCPIRERRV